MTTMAEDGGVADAASGSEGDRADGVSTAGAEAGDEVASQHRDVPLLKWLNVSIKETEKRAAGALKLQEAYVAYAVETNVVDAALVPAAFAGQPSSASVWRRYSDFELLRQYLVVTYPHAVVPPLPAKRTAFTLQRLMGDKYDPEFVERRRAGLEQFALRVCAQSVLSCDRYVVEFLRDDVDWKDSVTSTNFQSKADSKIKALSASYRVRSADERFEQLRAYSHRLEAHAAAVLKARESAADRVYGTHKIHTNYGRLLSELSRLERQGEDADALQKAGHFMDVYAQSIDVFLESEEDFADQLREYGGFGDALRSICRKRDLLQHQVEQAEDALAAKRLERTQAYEGKSGLLTGFRARMFGAPSAEQKEEKLRQLDVQIVEGEEAVSTSKADLAKFIEDSLASVEKFQRQKVKDIKDILLNFAVQQIERCKKSKATWESVKQSFDASG